MTSPLTTVNPKSLEEIFNSAPASLTDEELEIAVVELRRQRAKWQDAEAQGKRVAAPKAPKKTAKELMSLNIDDLGI